MTARRWVYEALASIVRATSATVFALEVTTVAVTVGNPGSATRMRGLGWIFWIGLGDLCGLLALACLAVYALMAVLRRSCGVEEKRDTRWCIGLCIATIVLMMFVPPINA